MNDYRFPTAREIEAIERRAAAMRAEVVAEGFRSFKARIAALGHIFQRTAHN